MLIWILPLPESRDPPSETNRYLRLDLGMLCLWPA